MAVFYMELPKSIVQMSKDTGFCWAIANRLRGSERYIFVGDFKLFQYDYIRIVLNFEKGYIVIEQPNFNIEGILKLLCSIFISTSKNITFLALSVSKIV